MTGVFHWVFTSLSKQTTLLQLWKVSLICMNKAKNVENYMCSAQFYYAPRISSINQHLLKFTGLFKGQSGSRIFSAEISFSQMCGILYLLNICIGWKQKKKLNCLIFYFQSTLQQQLLCTKILPITIFQNSLQSFRLSYTYLSPVDIFIYKYIYFLLFPISYSAHHVFVI